MSIEVIDLEKGWTFYVFTHYYSDEGKEMQFIRRCDVYSTTKGKSYRSTLHTNFIKTAASMNIRPANFTSQERKSIAKEFHDFRQPGKPLIYFSGAVVCYKVQDLIDILSKVHHPDLPKHIPTKLTQKILSLKFEQKPVPVRKRKREEEEQQVEIVGVMPKLWPKDMVEYGNAMRIFNGVEKQDFALPPVSPKVELFELPENHPAYGGGQNIGVRAVQDIAKGEELMHYAGLIEPFIDNGLPNMYVMHDPDEAYNCQHNALTFGNEARYINAYNNVQDKPNVEYGEFSQVGSRRSYNFVRSCRVMAIADIKKGEELLVDYGDGYWDHPSFKKTAEVTSQKEENKFSDLKILEIVTDETIIAKLQASRGINKFYLCSYYCNGEKCHKYLAPSQVFHILEHMYPQFQSKSVVEYTEQTKEGHVTKELCFFNGFVINKHLKNIVGVKLSKFGKPDIFFHRSINRISLPKIRKHIEKAKIGDTVFVQNGDHQLKMATLVGEGVNFVNDLKVRIFGDLDPDTLLPAVKTVHRIRVFEQ